MCLPGSEIKREGVYILAALTLVICGILFTIDTLDDPFAGQAEVQPKAFEKHPEH
ncbi:MAG: hypothetical protein ACJ732_08545 [Rubrobacteraceae bacterium]